MNSLQAAGPTNRSRAHLDHICTGGALGVMLTSKVSIRVCDKAIRGLVRCISELVVKCALEVTHEMLHGLPMGNSRVG